MSKNLYKQRVLEARKKFLELTQRNEEEILEIYKEASKVILKEIKENKELELSTEYEEKLYKSLKQYEDELNNKLASKIYDNTKECSDIATEIQLAYIEDIAPNEHINTLLNRITLASTKKALEKIVRGNFYKDGKSLDNRIWNITKKNVSDIDKLIKGNISRGANARKLAEQLEKYIDPKNRLNAKTLEAGMNSSISYQSQRLARTSISHAFSETCIENAKVNPFNKGLKWNLSPSHYERQVKKWGEDICDVYVNQDDYNLGKGVFPPNSFPVKHPNCLCYSTYVNTPTKEASEELKEWSMGAKNEKLDKWYSKHNNGNKYDSKAYNELAVSKEQNELLYNIQNMGDELLDIMEKKGGHTLSRHTSKKNEDLIRRAIKENVEASTSFTNKSTANKTVKENLRRNINEIEEWLQSEKNKIILDASHEYSIGKGVLEDKKHISYDLNNSRIVLAKDNRLELGFKIVTAFPIIK